MLRPTLAFAALSLTTMTLVDRTLGAGASFMNAWSVVERVLGRAPSAGTSEVAAQVGPIGEAVLVVAVNAGIGFVLARLWRRVRARSTTAA